MLLVHIVLFICSLSSPVTALAPGRRQQDGRRERRRNSGRNSNRCRHRRCSTTTERPEERVVTTPPTLTTSAGNSTDDDPMNCNDQCNERLRQEKKELRLNMIKAEILRQLGLKEPPNITRDQIPNVPPLEEIQREYSSGNRYQMQSDQPARNQPEDEYDAQPTTLIHLAGPSKYNYIRVAREVQSAVHLFKSTRKSTSRPKSCLQICKLSLESNPSCCTIKESWFRVCCFIVGYSPPPSIIVSGIIKSERESSLLCHWHWTCTAGQLVTSSKYIHKSSLLKLHLIIWPVCCTMKETQIYVYLVSCTMQCAVYI